ncbi:hypothetical protein MRX96_027337 [Rhipicephalus microplus]
MAKRVKEARMELSEPSESDGASSSSSSERKEPKEAPPKMIDMIVDAMNNLNDQRGASPIYLKKFILGKYPEIKTWQFQAKFKRTFLKALENNILVRIKATEHAEGVTGRVKLARKVEPRKNVVAPGSPATKRPAAGKSSNAPKTKAKEADGGTKTGGSGEVMARKRAGEKIKADKCSGGGTKAGKGPGGKAKAGKGPGGDVKAAKGPSGDVKAAKGSDGEEKAQKGIGGR